MSVSYQRSKIKSQLIVRNDAQVSRTLKLSDFATHIKRHDIIIKYSNAIISAAFTCRFTKSENILKYFQVQIGKKLFYLKHFKRTYLYKYKLISLFIYISINLSII